MSTDKTLLLVEDDASLLRLLSVILTNEGYDVRTAQDGFSALGAIRTEVPDILVSDLYMPGMSGFELLSVVRRRFPMIRVIAMSSAYSGPEIPVGIVADGFYEKATDVHALLETIKGVACKLDAGSAVSRSAATPLWLPWSADGSSGQAVVIGCPECMRSFTQMHTESAQVLCEAKCVYCGTLIPYAIIRPANAAPTKKLRADGEPLPRIYPAAC
jgi:CheY-like chemotaxis protein